MRQLYCTAYGLIRLSVAQNGENDGQKEGMDSTALYLDNLKHQPPGPQRPAFARSARRTARTTRSPGTPFYLSLDFSTSLSQRLSATGGRSAHVMTFLSRAFTGRIITMDRYAALSPVRRSMSEIRNSTSRTDAHRRFTFFTVQLGVVVHIRALRRSLRALRLPRR